MSDTLDLGIIGGDVLRRLSGRALGVALCTVQLEAGVTTSLAMVQDHTTIDSVGPEGIVLRGHASAHEFERGWAEQFCLIPWNQILSIQLSSPKLGRNKEAPANPYGVENRVPGPDVAAATRFKDVHEEFERRLKRWQGLPDPNAIRMMRKAAAILYAALKCGCRADSVADFVNGYLDTGRDEVSWLVTPLQDRGIWRPGGTLGWNITTYTDDAFWLAVYLVTGQVILMDS